MNFSPEVIAKGAEGPGASGAGEKALSNVRGAETTKPKGISAVAVLWTFGKCLSALLPVYLAGYYRVSTSLLVCGMMVYTGWKHAREAKEERLRSAIQLLDNEEEYTSMKSSKIRRDLPAWVRNNIKTSQDSKSCRHYVGNVEINVEVKRYFCKAGVKGIQLHGMMRVILEPLIGDVPIVGAVTMFFIRRPKLDINWTGLTNLLDIPGLNVMSDSMIMDAIASFLVLPNRLVVPLVPGLHVAQLRCPLPRGVVRIHLLEAQNLVAKDNYVKGVMAGLSDPYAILRMGPQTFTSKHIDNTDCPKWGEMYEVIVHEVPGQELEVEVYDKDTDKDDFLGRTKLDLGIVKKSIAVDDWFTLKDTPSGRVHFKLEWLALQSNTEQLEQVLKRNESITSKNSNPPSSAILVVYLDKAEALPMKKGNKEPNPMVQISVQEKTRDSKICYTTVNPEWEEAFTFFIQDPRAKDINVQVKDADRVQTLGNLTIPLSRVLETSHLSLDQWFQLENAGSASRIYINAVLRVLWLDEDRISAEVSSNVAAGLSKQLAQQSSPHPSFATEGLLRIHLLAGQNLVPKDNLMGGMVKGKSDPYVKLNIGGETFTSQVIKGNLNPTWNEMYEVNVFLSGRSDQDIKFEAFDKDIDSDDFLGRCVWFTLKDVKSGRVHLILEWVPTVSNPARLEQVLQLQTLQSYQNKAVPSAALLFVYIEAAHSLPVMRLLIPSTLSWNESFYFIIHDPKRQMLVAKARRFLYGPMGSLVITIKELLAAPQLVLDQWFHLDGALPDSQILLRAELKVRTYIKLYGSKMVEMIGSGTLPCAAPAPGNGQVKLSLLYTSKEKKLVVIVHACRGLLSQSKDAVDSYVSLMLLPDKSKATKKKTAVKKRDLNPEYNERFEYDLPEDEARFRRLSVSVKNNSASFRSRDVIGQVQIELAQIDLKSGITDW
uniref:Extended synaptotagmin 1 n=1 Tax=Xiphophorus maculatus TaxID=8083 RepID=A0A3B5QWR7_XIPMA